MKTTIKLLIPIFFALILTKSVHAQDDWTYYNTVDGVEFYYKYILETNPNKWNVKVKLINTYNSEARQVTLTLKFVDDSQSSGMNSTQSVFFHGKGEKELLFQPWKKDAQLDFNISNVKVIN